MILLIASILLGSLFWMPSFERDYKPLPKYKPTKKERYVRNINKLLDQGHYDVVTDLLARTKYAHEELPWEHWREEVSRQITKSKAHVAKLASLQKLEELLS